MWCMTDQGRHDGPPGRPLWQAAERKRIAEGWTKTELVERIGIGRVTFDRLQTQENPPIARTVKKIANGIGLDIYEAMRLSGLDDISADVAMTNLDGTRTYLQVKHYSPEVERTLAGLRETADKLGRTLGDVLVLTGLVSPEELKLTEDEIVREIDNDDLPDDIRQEFLDGYRRLKEQIAETARRRESSG